MAHIWMDDEILRCACCGRGYQCDCEGDPCEDCGKCEGHCRDCVVAGARDMEADQRMELEAEGD